MSLFEAKAAIRQAALERRAAVDEATREAFATRLALKGVEIARHSIVRTVAAFWPIRDEPDTRGLVHALSYHEFVAALPVMVARGRPLMFRGWTPRDRMVEGAYGVMEPSSRLPEVLPDIVFVPLAAFDRKGHRVGYGAGFYDATIADLRNRKPILAIGVGYSVQEVPEVPAEAHDQALDLILTETDLITCRAN